jgi:alkylhydroperoxidase family enzyme
VDINAAVGSEAGASVEKITALSGYKSSPLFPAAEKVALEFADGASATPHDVSDELFTRVRAHYNEAQVVELAYIIATENLSARFNRSFRVEPQGFFCLVPAAVGST